MPSPKLVSPPRSCWDSPEQEIDVKMVLFSSPMSSASPSRSHSAPHPTLTSCCPNRQTPILGERSGLQTPCIWGWLTETELLLGKSSAGKKPPLLRLCSRGQAPRVTRGLHTHPHPLGPPARAATAEQRQDKEPGQAGGDPPSPAVHRGCLGTGACPRAWRAQPQPGWQPAGRANLQG